VDAACNGIGHSFRSLQLRLGLDALVAADPHFVQTVAEKRTANISFANLCIH